MTNKLRILLILITLTISQTTWAQFKKIGMPYIYNYTSKETTSQNWASVMDTLGIMYFGCNNGVLSFDGVHWKLTQINGKAVKALAIDPNNGTIFVGSKGDFGYLKNTTNGQLTFHSLFDKVPVEHSTYSDIWKIIVDEKEGVIFEATTGLYIYKDDTVKVLPSKDGDGFNGIFKTQKYVFAISSTEGIKEIKNGQLIDAKYLQEAGTSIKLIRDYQGGLLIFNNDKGAFLYSDGECQHLDIALNQKIRRDLLSFYKTREDIFLLGTLSQGLIVADEKLNIINHIPTSSYVTSIYEDHNGRFWVTTGNGIMMLDFQSPFSVFTNESTGIRGTIKTELQVGNTLYIGADAVYKIQLDSLYKSKFQEVKCSDGRIPVWSLDTIRGQIIGCTQMGLIHVYKNSVVNVNKNHTINIFTCCVPKENPNVMVAGGSNGLSIYDYKDSTWTYRRGINKFYTSVRTIKQDSDGFLWTSDGSNCVHKLKLNETYDSLVTSQQYNSENGLPNQGNFYILNVGKEITVGTEDGLYVYDNQRDTFAKDEKINKLLGGTNTYDFVYNDYRGNLWMKHKVKDPTDSNNTLWYLEQFQVSDSNYHKISERYRPYVSHIYSLGYISNNCYIIGDKDRFIHYDQNIKKDFQAPYAALIRKMERIKDASLIYGGNNPNYKIVLPDSMRSVRIMFSAVTYEYPEEIKFKTYLENNDDGWSDYRSESYKEYPNLRPGKYTLHVVAKNCYNVESQEAKISFVVLPPWYRTIWAIIFYVILGAFLFWMIIKMYTKKLTADKEKLERIVEERTTEIRKQAELIIEKNKEITEINKNITDSIHYARKIQRAMLPLDEKIAAVLPNHFILFRPKDIVSGDYYWYAETDKNVLITAADCTGHGVPGAFMSMIGSQILTEIINENITSPDEVLTNQNRRIRKALKQDTTDNQDGMDMALCRIDKQTHLVEYSGAKNQLLVIKNGEMIEYKADKQGIGGQQFYGTDYQFTKVAIEPDGNTWFYMFSDGYKDQFGGPKNSKFLIKNLRNLLLKIHNEPPQKQREVLDNVIQKWIDQGSGEQTDDILILGFKL